MIKFRKTVSSIEGLNRETMKQVKDILNGKMKPQGSLGFLEEIAVKIAGITGKIGYEINNSVHIVAASDNGIVEEGVSSCPVEYTRIVSEAMLQKIAAIGILCEKLKIDFQLIDVGIDGELKKEYPNFIRKKISLGTKNFFKEPAMTMEQCIAAIEVGIEIVEKLQDRYDIFSNGEMGIGNTSTSSAVLYAITGEPIEQIVGRGGGLSDSALDRKKKIIVESCEKHKIMGKDPLLILSKVGGYDIACMVGMYLGAGALKKPMIIDGFISSVAALVACEICPELKGHLIASHISEEPGMKVVLKRLGVSAPLHMNMRLGEGTGAVFLHNFAKCAMEIPKLMKTKDEVYKLIK